MENERRETLRRKYLSLGAGELVAATGFAAIAAWFVAPRFAQDEDLLALWSALIPLLVVLVQASAYWLSARSWVGRAHMPKPFAALYRFFRIADPVILLVGLIGVIAWMPDQPGAALLVVGVWAFAVIEYLNYFVVRLSYPFTRWFTLVGQWRTPRLVQDLHTRMR